MDKSFFAANRNKLMGLLEESSLVVLFAGDAPQRSADQNYIFTPNRNFYYLTGVEREKAIYMAIKNKERIREYLFIEKGDPVLEKWIGKRMSQDEAKEISGLDTIKYLESFEGVFHQELNSLGRKNVFLDLEKRGFKAIPTKALLFAQEVTKGYPQVNIEDIHETIAKLRVVKSTEEIEKLQKAIDITNEGIKALMKNSKAGMFEYQMEAHFDFTIKSEGAKSKAFNTIAAAGGNATVLHYEENNSLTEDGQLILFDLGAEYQHYCADISRTIPINGKFTQRQKDIYNVVLRALEEATAMVRPGVTFNELNEHAKSVLSKGCKELGIIKDDGELSQYYYHGIGHFLGLDTHDVGDRFAPLQEGMVLTIEPGLYIEQEGIGIRIEDDILVTSDGYKNLSANVIKTVEEIEQFMGK